MSEDLAQEVQEEVARISALPLEDQPAAFAAIRDLLEKTLNSDGSAAEQSGSGSDLNQGP